MLPARTDDTGLTAIVPLRETDCEFAAQGIICKERASLYLWEITSPHQPRYRICGMHDVTGSATRP